MIGSESEDIMDSMKDTPTLKGEKPMKIIRKAKGISVNKIEYIHIIVCISKLYWYITTLLEQVIS